MSRSAERRTLIIVSLALFMVVLDNLVVTVALPSIRHAFGAGVQSLEWTVNAYTLSYAVLLLTGAALGEVIDRALSFDWAGRFASAVEIGPVDLAVVAVKTTAARMAELVRPLLGPETAILTLQNGLGADESLAGLFGAGLGLTCGRVQRSG